MVVDTFFLSLGKCLRIPPECGTQAGVTTNATVTAYETLERLLTLPMTFSRKFRVII